MTARLNDSPGAGAGNSAAAQPPAQSIDQSRFCLECASRGHTCCQSHEIFVTWGDCRRIFAYTQRKDFYEYRKCTNIAYADQDDDPIWQQHVFRSDGSRRVLRQNIDGDCILLTPTGCSLPLTVRPLVCRLFPHMYSAEGLDPGWDVECPAATHCRAEEVAAGIAGVEWKEAEQWHDLLYDEVLWEVLVDENWLNV
jgi:Fe-S-cluster containining protein